jgi:hypothetical protein
VIALKAFSTSLLSIEVMKIAQFRFKVAMQPEDYWLKTCKQKREDHF